MGLEYATPTTLMALFKSTLFIPSTIHISLTLLVASCNIKLAYIHAYIVEDCDSLRLNRLASRRTLSYELPPSSSTGYKLSGSGYVTQLPLFSCCWKIWIFMGFFLHLCRRYCCSYSTIQPSLLFWRWMTLLLVVVYFFI